MSDEYAGEIRWFPYARGAPENWLVCDGSLQPISGNEVLFQLIGTTYGGDGSTNFGVPDLRGRVPVHQGTGTGLTPRAMGTMDGTEQVTLNTAQMPPHSHAFQASTAPGTMPAAKANVLAQLPDGDQMYWPTAPSSAPVAPMPQMFGTAGSGQPHQNCAPTLPILPCIASYGVYPQKP